MMPPTDRVLLRAYVDTLTRGLIDTPRTRAWRSRKIRDMIALLRWRRSLTA